LAYRRHFPAINWLNSYSLYEDSLRPWYEANISPDFTKNRAKAMAILQEESSLNEIVQLVGKDSLSANDQLTLETARMIREDFLQQNAFVDIDWFSDYRRQFLMLQLILTYDQLCRAALEKGADLTALFEIKARNGIGRAKTVPVDQYEAVYAKLAEDMAAEIEELAAKGEEY
jgi:V/A-type H+-transporting ATPase subunit A